MTLSIHLVPFLLSCGVPPSPIVITSIVVYITSYFTFPPNVRTTIFKMDIMSLVINKYIPGILTTRHTTLNAVVPVQVPQGALFPNLVQQMMEPKGDAAGRKAQGICAKYVSIWNEVISQLDLSELPATQLSATQASTEVNHYETIWHGAASSPSQTPGSQRL